MASASMSRQSSIAPLRTFLALRFAGALVACHSASPDLKPNDPEMMMMPPPTDPPVRPNENITVSGSIRRLDAYLRGEDVYLPGATVTPLGTIGAAPATADAQGAFAIDVPQNGKIIFEIEKGLHVTTYEELFV